MEENQDLTLGKSTFKMEYDKFESEESKKYKDKLNISNGFLTPFKYPEQPKHYLGDVKWVLYQTIVDLGSKDRFVFRCGSYAYSKIKNIFKCNDEEYEDMVKLDLNGETIIMILCTRLDKKQMIISNKDEAEYCDFYHETIDNYESDIRENEIVLYFA